MIKKIFTSIFVVLLIVSYIQHKRNSSIGAEVSASTITQGSVPPNIPEKAITSSSGKLSSAERKAIDTIKALLVNSSLQMHSEITNYRQKMEELNKQADVLYSGLSRDARDFMITKNTLIQELSDEGRKTLESELEALEKKDKK